ncbi:hypothetical protein HNY73_015610 [Argiope bruennichi]|uniref:Uncharacterized protein n=1 Tax=Argiope bruennichi TaxID=94029 RepID=A0A8T0EX32_ARGBR|nr:hypothetical protein HNY73_015610 [Argiope bruennichi]
MAGGGGGERLARVGELRTHSDWIVNRVAGKERERGKRGGRQGLTDDKRKLKKGRRGGNGAGMLSGKSTGLGEESREETERERPVNNHPHGIERERHEWKRDGILDHPDHLLGQARGDGQTH